MQSIADILIHSNTLNFFIAAGILVFICIKLKISGKLADKAAEIKDYVETAENERKNAEKKLDIINTKTVRLPDVIERIKKSAENNINNYSKKVQENIEEQKTDISKNAARALDFETKKFKTGLAALLSEKSIETARKNAAAQLKDNQELQEYYIDKAIEELDGVLIYENN